MGHKAWECKGIADVGVGQQEGTKNVGSLEVGGIWTLGCVEVQKENLSGASFFGEEFLEEEEEEEECAGAMQVDTLVNNGKIV